MIPTWLFLGDKGMCVGVSVTAKYVTKSTGDDRFRRLILHPKNSHYGPRRVGTASITRSVIALSFGRIWNNNAQSGNCCRRREVNGNEMARQVAIKGTNNICSYIGRWSICFRPVYGCPERYLTCFVSLTKTLHRLRYTRRCHQLQQEATLPV